MTIETKYNIGDEVWKRDWLEGRNLVGEVVNITVNCNYGHHLTVIYEVSNKNNRNESIKSLESDLFPTKEELLKSL